MVKVDIPQRYIKKNTRSLLPKRILYLDTESKIEKTGDEEHHTLRSGWTCYINSKHSKEKPSETWREWFYSPALNDYIESLARDKDFLYVIGHNIYYDLQSTGFFYYFPHKKWTLDFIYDQGMSFILCIRKGKKQIKLLSSTNYFTCSLGALGDMIGIKKGDPDFNNVCDTELSQYCKNDVLILKKAMEYYYKFISDNDLGRFSMTRGSQAFNAFRHRFMFHKIGVHTNEKIVKLERAAYHGGRTECFRFGYQPPVAYCTLDVNSMYPFVMSNFELPVKCIDFAENPDVDRLKFWLQKWCLIGECFLDTDDPAYAVKHEDKLVFPVGRFKAFLCTSGLKYAFERGHIKQITQLAFYEKAVIFQPYVEYIYDLRKQYEKENNEIMSLLCKYLLNSLYGKFGQRIPVFEKEISNIGKNYYRMQTVNLVTGETQMEYKLFNTVIREMGLIEGRNTFVAIPAHITEYSRFILWDLIKKAGPRAVYYCDTDSLKMPVYKTGKLSADIDPERLGALKIEDVFAPFIINGNKNYQTGRYRKTKGVPRNAQQIDSITWKYLTFLRSPSHQVKQVDKYFIVKETVKKTPPFYDKGNVRPGGIVDPFTFFQF